MSHSPSQAFWREVLDQVAPMILVFRIAENDTAHLMYANDPVRTWLGYAPPDFVARAEQAGPLATALTAMVDDMARKSHGPAEGHGGSVRLPDATGREVDFHYRFRLYQSASARAWVMAVTLEPGGRGAEPAPAADFLVASPFLTTLQTRLVTLASAGIPVWFQGVPGTGRRTLAERYARMCGGKRWVADARKVAAKEWAGMKDEVVAVVSDAAPDEILKTRKWDAAAFHARGFQVVPVPGLRMRPEDAAAYAYRLAEAVGADGSAVAAGLAPVDTYPALRSAVFRKLAGDPAETFAVRPYEAVVAEYLERVMGATEGRIYGKDGAAALLKLKPTTLQSKLKRLGVR